MKDHIFFIFLFLEFAVVLVRILGFTLLRQKPGFDLSPG